MTTSHWSAYHERWARLTPPLRPSPEVALAVASAISAHPAPMLLLGVTPELSSISADVTAVDKSEAMIGGVWPGNTEARRAVRADWLSLPFTDASFAAAVGDGSLNALTYPDAYHQLSAELVRVLFAGGRAVIRMFLRPPVAEPLSEVCNAAHAGHILSFHAFKWRFAMALTARSGSPNIRVQSIHEAFLSALPDRLGLSRETGWKPEDIDTIEVYRDSPEVYSFPSADELLACVEPHFRRTSLQPVGGYELAERCPLLVLDR